MPPRNSLRENDHPREQKDGKDIINTRKQRTTRIVGPDGAVQEIIMDISDSRPDENGAYIDAEMTNLSTDAAGNIMPENPHDIIAISHTGLYITSPEQKAECSSWLHPGNRSRAILIGQDGRTLGQGRAICSHCDFWLGTIYIVLGVLGLGIIIGVWKAVGLF